MTNQSVPAYRRAVHEQVASRLLEPRRFIQVLSGPRQTGKTTLALQLVQDLGIPTHYASADEPSLKDRGWISVQWDIGRLRSAEGEPGTTAVLILDEIHKLTGWSETVKRLWDEDTAAGLPVRVVLLGSAPILVQQGLSESLAGRFEVTNVPHWSYGEMREAFGWTLDEYVYFGGYPGAAPLVHDEWRWARYVLDSLIETTVSRDVLLVARVDKPALLRRLFYLACTYSGQILSYQKMLGQLHDAGNTTTLAHYLDLLSSAGLVTGLQKYSGSAVRRRASSPKLQVLNSALTTAQAGSTFNDARQDRATWGRLVESAVGSHLVNATRSLGADVYYWRERGLEVDFVLASAERLVAIEVKASHRQASTLGLTAFADTYEPTRRLLVGREGIGLEEFLVTPVAEWLR